MISPASSLTLPDAADDLRTEEISIEITVDDDETPASHPSLAALRAEGWRPFFHLEQPASPTRRILQIWLRRTVPESLHAPRPPA